MNNFEELIINNKLGIKDLVAFEKESRIYTEIRANELLKAPINGKFDFNHLKAIHKHLFQDVFQWAGKDRLELGLKNEFSKPDLKGNITNFVPGVSLHNTANQIFTWLKEDNFLKDCKNINEFSKQISEIYRNLDYLHPFREGNCRTQRIFLNQLADNAGYKMDLNIIPKDKIINASAEAINGNLSELEAIIKENLESFKENLTKSQKEPKITIAEDGTPVMSKKFAKELEEKFAEQDTDKTGIEI